MLVKSKGIVLRSIKYGETSLILDIYSRDYGLNSYIASGIRAKNSKNKIGNLQLMSLIEFVAYHKSAKTLYRVKEANPHYLYRRIPFEIKRSSIGMFMVEILKNCLKEDEGNESLFQFIVDWFMYLDTSEQAVSNLHLLFMLELSSFIGFQPMDNFNLTRPFFDLQEGQFVSEMPSHIYYLKAGESEILYDLLMQEREFVHELKLSNSQRRNLLEKLIQFYKLHIDTIGTLHTYQILNEILA